MSIFKRCVSFQLEIKDGVLFHQAFQLAFCRGDVYSNGGSSFSGQDYHFVPAEIRRDWDHPSYNCNLKEYVKKKGLPKGLTLGSCSILETVGQGALASLYQTLQSAIGGKDSESSTSGKIIWLHFGVNSGATRFAIEHQAVNEATFRCPEELGWKPQKLPIIPADGDISHTRQVAWISFFMIFLIKRVS
nr:uncharacterized protein LOC112021583 isoform X1 [Quercus suber]